MTDILNKGNAFVLLISILLLRPNVGSSTAFREVLWKHGVLTADAVIPFGKTTVEYKLVYEQGDIGFLTELLIRTATIEVSLDANILKVYPGVIANSLKLGTEVSPGSDLIAIEFRYKSRSGVSIEEWEKAPLLRIYLNPSGHVEAVRITSDRKMEVDQLTGVKVTHLKDEQPVR